MDNQSNSFSDATGRYAKSIFQLASEKNILNEVENNFSQLNLLMQDSVDFKKFVVNPTVQNQARLKIIESLATKLSCYKIFINFLKLINEKGRFFFLEKIIKDFFSILSINKGEVIADLIIANEITEDKKNEIKKELSQLYKKDIKLNFSIDESLISGSILKVGSKMIDNSAKSKFNRILNNI